jgi:hypothetical protein
VAAACRSSVTTSLGVPPTDLGSTSPPHAKAWLEGQLHVHFLADPLTWAPQHRIALDPISGSYVAGSATRRSAPAAPATMVSSVAGTGTANYIWRNTDASPDNFGVRWENGAPKRQPVERRLGPAPPRRS